MLADWWPACHFGWLAGREVVCLVAGRWSSCQLGWSAPSQLGWLDGARDVWLVSWLVVEDGEACREAVCLDEWLVVKDGEAGR